MALIDCFPTVPPSLAALARLYGGLTCRRAYGAGLSRVRGLHGFRLHFREAQRFNHSPQRTRRSPRETNGCEGMRYFLQMSNDAIAGESTVEIPCIRWWRKHPSGSLHSYPKMPKAGILGTPDSSSGRKLLRSPVEMTKVESVAQ